MTSGVTSTARSARSIGPWIQRHSPLLTHRAHQPSLAVTGRRWVDGYVVRPTRLVPCQLAVGHPVRTGRFGAEAFDLVLLVGRRNCPRTRTTSPRCRRRPPTPGCACRCGPGTSGRGEITTAQPGKFSSAFSSELRVSTSRSLVGSSSRIRLPPSLSVSARLSRLRSPPDSTPAGFCWSGPLNPNADT